MNQLNEEAERIEFEKVARKMKMSLVRNARKPDEYAFATQKAWVIWMIWAARTSDVVEAAKAYVEAKEAFEKWAEDNDFDTSPHDYPLDGVPMYREDITEAAYEAYQASRQDSMAMIAELVGALKFYAPSGHHVHTCRYSDGELVDMYSTVSEDGGKIATAALTKAEAFMKGETV